MGDIMNNTFRILFRIEKQLFLPLQAAVQQAAIKKNYLFSVSLKSMVEA